MEQGGGLGSSRAACQPGMDTAPCLLLSLCVQGVQQAVPMPARLLTDTRPPDGPRDGHDCLLLPDDAVVQRLLHLDQALALVTAHLLDGDACAAASRAMSTKQI